MKTTAPMVSSLVAMLLMVLITDPARAEGGSCPAGYYPVGGGGSIGCAPIPSSGAVRGSSPTLRWEKRWGAIAYDPASGLYAIANQKESRQIAKKEALSDCGQACKIQLVYYNQCFAMAQGQGPLMLATAPSKPEAERSAFERCTAVSNECALLESLCSVPVLVR